MATTKIEWSDEVWKGPPMAEPLPLPVDSTRIVVHGHPAPQGSKRAFRNQHTGRIQQVESSKAVAPWRMDVRQAVADQAPDAHYDGPTAVDITFTFARPKSHWRTGRNAHLLRDAAPEFPAGRKDDIDKLARATLDALTSTGLLADDGQVVDLHARKVYIGHADALERPGARIDVDAAGGGG